MAPRRATYADRRGRIVPGAGEPVRPDQARGRDAAAARGGDQGVRFAAARLGSVYGPWEYATGVRDTLSPMLQALECARRGEEAVLGPAWRGDFVFSRDVADGLVRLADAPALSRTVYNLGSGRSARQRRGARRWRSWCRGFAGGAPRRARRGMSTSHTGFHRGPMAIGKIARDTGFVPRHDSGPDLAASSLLCATFGGEASKEQPSCRTTPHRSIFSPAFASSISPSSRPARPAPRRSPGSAPRW